MQTPWPANTYTPTNPYIHYANNPPDWRTLHHASNSHSEVPNTGATSAANSNPHQYPPGIIQRGFHVANQPAFSGQPAQPGQPPSYGPYGNLRGGGADDWHLSKALRRISIRKWLSRRRRSLSPEDFGQAAQVTASLPEHVMYFEDPRIASGNQSPRAPRSDGSNVGHEMSSTTEEAAKNEALSVGTAGQNKAKEMPTLRGGSGNLSNNYRQDVTNPAHHTVSNQGTDQPQSLRPLMLTLTINFSVRDEDWNMVILDDLHNTNTPYELRVHYHSVALMVLQVNEVAFRIDFEDPRYYIIEDSPTANHIFAFVGLTQQYYAGNPAYERFEAERLRKWWVESSSGSEPAETLTQFQQRFEDQHAGLQEYTSRLDGRMRGGAGAPGDLYRGLWGEDGNPLFTDPHDTTGTRILPPPNTFDPTAQRRGESFHQQPRGSELHRDAPASYSEVLRRPAPARVNLHRSDDLRRDGPQGYFDAFLRPELRCPTPPIPFDLDQGASQGDRSPSSRPLLQPTVGRARPHVSSTHAARRLPGEEIAPFSNQPGCDDPCLWDAVDLYHVPVGGSLRVQRNHANMLEWAVVNTDVNENRGRALRFPNERRRRGEVSPGAQPSASIQDAMIPVSDADDEDDSTLVDSSGSSERGRLAIRAIGPFGS